MTYAFAQGTVSCSVVDGQVDIDVRDFDVPHDAVPGEVENGTVFLGCRLQGFLSVATLRFCTGDKGFVIGGCLLPLLNQNAVIRLGDYFLIGGEYLRRILLVYEIADNRVQR